MITAEGIVLRERAYGEQDKFIDILTKESGLLELSVKGARKINGSSGSSTQLFAYSKFCFDSRKDKLILNSAEPIHIFYGLRDSITKFSLASYFAEILKYCIEENTSSGDILRLMLNTLYYLEKGSRSEEMLKSIFEMRLMSEIGFMPDIVICRVCGKYEPSKAYFFYENGSFCCEECAGAETQNSRLIDLSVLTAIRHIVLSDFSKLYNFRLSDNSLKSLSAITERYLLEHLGRSFGTLEFYRSIL